VNAVPDNGIRLCESPTFGEYLRSTMSSPQPTYKFHSIDDILSLPDPVWLLEGLLIKGAIAVLFGPPGVGAFAKPLPPPTEKR
jgi:hypothetical protein